MPDVRYKCNFLKIVALIFFIVFTSLPMPMQGSGSKILPEGAIYFGAKYNYGSLWAHRTLMRHLVKGHTQSILLSIGFQRYGSKPWEHVFNYVSTGFAFQFSYLGNEEQLGNIIGFFPYINFPVLRRNRITMGYRWGAGAGYLEKPFDKKDNYKNNAIGSHLNFLMSVIWEMQFRVMSNLAMTADISFTHLSNGDVRIPNLGLNIVAVGAGISYTFCNNNKTDYCNRKLRFNKDSLPSVDKKIHYNVVVGFSKKQVFVADPNIYEAFMATATAGKPIGRRRRLGIGADVFYDNSLKVVNNSDTNKIRVNSDFIFIRPGIHISHELVLGKLSAVTEMGFYIYTMYKGDGYFYHRVALRYHFFEHYIFNFSIKSHWANADSIEWGLGYKF